MIVILMGVSGAGKTTVGCRLAARLGADYLEGDAFHPPENVAKMRRGEPLDDDDRGPWLERLRARLQEAEHDRQPVVVACSALTRRYREILARGLTDARIVHLQGARDLIARRLAARRCHYMPESQLDSQFATLEEPAADESVIAVSIAQDPGAVVESVLRALNEKAG